MQLKTLIAALAVSFLLSGPVLASDEPNTTSGSVGNESVAEPNTTSGSVGNESVAEPSTTSGSVGNESVAEPNTTSGSVGNESLTEPHGYRTDHYRAPVPETLNGAKVIDTEAAEAMFKAGAIFIDVFPQARKPPNLPKSTIWRAPKHESIKGAVWLPNVGYGVLNADFETYFRTHLEKLTGGDNSRPLVFFCLRNCWMSWNAAKRALEWGHTDVTWYPDGVDGWKEWNLEVDRVKPAE